MFERKTALPDDAVALIIYQKVDKTLNPVAWTRVTKGQTQFTYQVTFGGINCSRQPNRPIFGDGNVAVAWVDKYGRLSAASAPVRVSLMRT